MKQQKFSSPDDSNQSNEDLPAVGQNARVMHNGRERIAYRDADGKWRESHTGNVLQGEVQVLKE